MILRISIIIFLSILTIAAQAQFNPTGERTAQTERRTSNILTGKWQEYKRTEGKRRKAQEIKFDDPLQLQFMPDSSVRIWLNNGQFYTEYYEFNNAGFHFGDRYHFTFFEVGEKEMNLGDGNLKRSFKRVDKLNKAMIAKKVPGVERGNVQTSASFLVGKWSTYKKEDKNYSAKKYYLKGCLLKKIFKF